MEIQIDLSDSGHLQDSVSCLGKGRDPTASSILTRHNNCNLNTTLWNRRTRLTELGLREAHVTTITPPRPTRIPRGFETNPRIDAVTTRAPAASGEAYCYQAILKF